MKTDPILAALIMLFSTATLAAQKRNIESIPEAKPFVLGVIDEVHSNVLNEKRILNIFLPEGYHENKDQKYPVIYLLDGSADEDFIHIAGLVQFNSFEWVNQVPKSIVVGIATVDRRRDFTFPTTETADKERFPTSGHSGRFISFLENELQPFISKKYKTNNDKTIIGQSFGGLLATEILLKKPHLFNYYIIVSPSLWWDNGSLLSLDPAPAENIKVYIGVGKEGLTPTTVPRVMEVDANVLADKIIRLDNPAIEVFFDYLPQENHATILHQAVLNSFKLLRRHNER